MAAKKFKDLAEPLYNDRDAASRIEQYKQEMRSETAAYQLAELRRSLGLGQVELASRCGMTQGGFSKLERSTDPKLSTLHKLAEALGGTLKIEIEIDGEAFDITGDSGQ